MRRLYLVPLRTLVLEALYIMSTNTLPASAANMHRTPSYFRRERDADLCGAESLFPCDLDGLPKNYCCKAGTRCLLGAARTTIVCCPEGSDCEAIKPILCDLPNQDPTLAPESLVKSILLDGTLQSCGLGCCPWGYHCGAEANGEPACYRDEDQDSFPQGAIIPTVSSSSQLAGPTSTKTATSTGLSAPGVTTSPLDGDGSSEGSDDGGNNAVAIGLAVGVTAAGLLIIAGAFFIARKRRKGQIRGGGGGSRSSGSHMERKPSTTLSFGNFISEPIMNPDTLRSDFGRLKEVGGSSTANSAGTTYVNTTNPRNSIERYWGKRVWLSSDSRSNSNPRKKNSNRPHMAAGPKVGIAKVGSAKGNTRAPQTGEISTAQPETTVVISRGGNGESDMLNPFRDNAHRYDHSSVDGPVSPMSVSASSFTSVTVSPIRAMNSSTSRPYTPTPGRKRRPITPPNKNIKATTGTINKTNRPREPSGTKIDVFADPATLADSPGLGIGVARGEGGWNEGSGAASARYSTHTTFSDMMERAELGDLARGGGYVLPPSPLRAAHEMPMRRR